MDLFFDKAANRLTTTAGGRGILRSQEWKRGDMIQLRLRVYDGETPSDLGATWKIAFGMKESFAGELLALASEDDWTEDDGVYSASLNLNTVEMVAALAGAAFLDTLGELTVSEDDGATWQSSQTLTVKVRNDVIQGDEGTPIELPDADDFVGDRAVRYDEAQALNAAQRSQALQNVGLVGGVNARVRLFENPDGGWDLMLWNQDQEIYQRVVLAGGPGAEYLFVPAP